MSFHMLSPFVSTTDEYEPLEARDLVVLFCGVYVFPALGLAGLLWFLRRRLSSVHRRVLSKLLDLLTLSQVLVVTTGYDALSDLVCSPTVLEARLGADQWSGNTRCSELPQRERDAVPCGYMGTVQVYTSLLGVWSLLLLLFTFLAVSRDEASGSGILTRSAFRRVSLCLVVNCGLWTLLNFYTLSKRGPCRTDEAATATANLFAVLSYGLLMLELFLPYREGEIEEMEAAAAASSSLSALELRGRHKESQAGDAPRV